MRVRRGIEAARAVLVVGDNLPGLSVAVAVDGEIVWAEGFGWADVESRTPITPVTRFRLGALSKPLTAVGAALLHDRERLDSDVPVQRYVPAYPKKQWTVTTRQLMGDVAGVHRIRGDSNDAMPTAHCASLDEAVALLDRDPLLFEPGTQHRCSIWGWMLVSAVVEGAAGEPFSRFMARQVFEPLGMERTVVAETEGLDGTAHQAGRRPDYSCVAGGGAFLSTPTDLVRFGSAMLKPGLLRADTIAAFQTPTRLASGASTTYALGWTVNSVRLAGEPARIVSHRGSRRRHRLASDVPGFSASRLPPQPTWLMPGGSILSLYRSPRRSPGSGIARVARRCGRWQLVLHGRPNSSTDSVVRETT